MKLEKIEIAGIVAIMFNFALLFHWGGKVDVKLEADYNRLNKMEEQIEKLKDTDRSNLLREIENLKK